MQPARSARHAGPAHRRRSARTVSRLVLLAIALLALALVLSPLGLGLASADAGDAGDESGPGVQNNCIHRDAYYTYERGWVYVCLDHRPGSGGQEESGGGPGTPGDPPPPGDQAPPPPDGGLGGPNSPPDFESGQGLCCGSEIPGADPANGGGWL